LKQEVLQLQTAELDFTRQILDLQSENEGLRRANLQLHAPGQGVDFIVAPREPTECQSLRESINRCMGEYVHASGNYVHSDPGSTRQKKMLSKPSTFPVEQLKPCA
jgi:hypothetical protein